jgi:hypothetical protein
MNGRLVLVVWIFLWRLRWLWLRGDLLMAELEKFILRLQTTACHSLLNRDQKQKFIEADVMRFLGTLEETDLPGIRAAIRISRHGWGTYA